MKSGLPKLIPNGNIIAKLCKSGSDDHTVLDIKNVIDWEIAQIGSSNFLKILKQDNSYNLLKIEDIQELEVYQ